MRVRVEVRVEVRVRVRGRVRVGVGVGVGAEWWSAPPGGLSIRLSIARAVRHSPG